MREGIVERDERTEVVEGTAYRWGYLVLSFGLLAVAAYRSFARGERVWDLLGLVVAAGFVNTLYLAGHRTLYRRWVFNAAMAFILAALIAAVLLWLR
jgi:hypothetical protein